MLLRKATFLMLAFSLALMFGCVSDSATDTSESVNPRAGNSQPPDNSAEDGMTPEESLEKLQAGNASYVENRNAADLSADRREETATNGQHPYAIVVTCSDSRVPPEHLFNAGIGDIFVIRTAGNVIGPFELGSIEYGVEHLGAPLVVVLGHTNCGAVNAAIEGDADGNIQHIVDEITLGIGDERDSKAAVIKNASHSLERIMESEIVAQQVAEGSVRMMPALYDIETGEVTWL